MRARDLCILACLLLALGGFAPGVTAEPEATITLGTDPEPPECAANPDGLVTISWVVEQTSTPDHVHYMLKDPSLAIIEEEIYPGMTGLTVTRTWEVPSGAIPGGYWVRVEFYATDGMEAAAEVLFLVCDEPTSPNDGTWGEIKRLFLR